MALKFIRSGVVAFFCMSFIPGVSMALTAPWTKPHAQEIDKTLDAFHEAASKADGKTYFALFAPEGVFIGTDAAERWTVAEFKKYAEPHFKKGKGWTYTKRTRNIDFSPAGDVAWFDEILDSVSYGTSRGSGVLRKVEGVWKIAQYHLTFPIPNELADKFTKEIKTLSKNP
jgi:ketosteroid isomerase-like protein